MSGELEAVQPKEKKPDRCCWVPTWPHVTAFWEGITAPVDGVYLGLILGTVWTSSKDVFWGLGGPDLTGIALGTTAGVAGLIIHLRFNSDYQKEEAGDSDKQAKAAALKEFSSQEYLENQDKETTPLVDTTQKPPKPSCPTKSLWHTALWLDGFAHTNVLASSPILLLDQLLGAKLPWWGPIPLYSTVFALAGMATWGQIRPCKATVMHHLYGTEEDIYDKQPPDFFTWSATIAESISALINCYSYAQLLDLFTEAAPAFWNISASGAAFGIFLGLWALVGTGVLHTNVTMMYQNQNHGFKGDEWQELFKNFTPIQKAKFIVFMIGDFIGHAGTYATSTNIVVSGKVRSLDHLYKVLIYSGITVGGTLAAKAESLACRVEAAVTMRDNADFFTFRGFFGRKKPSPVAKPISSALTPNLV